MIRVAAIALVLVSAALLQTALFPYLALAGYRPDLLLLVTAVFALRDGALTGVLVGFAAGILADLLLVEPAVGLTAIVMVAIGYAIGVVRPYLAVGSVTAPVAIAFLSGAIGTAAYGLLSRLLGDPRYTLDLVLQAGLLVGLYNTLLAPLMVAVVNVVSSRFPPERTAPL